MQHQIAQRTFLSHCLQFYCGVRQHSKQEMIESRFCFLSQPHHFLPCYLSYHLMISLWCFVVISFVSGCFLHIPLIHVVVFLCRVMIEKCVCATSVGACVEWCCQGDSQKSWWLLLQPGPCQHQSPHVLLPPWHHCRCWQCLEPSGCWRCSMCWWLPATIGLSSLTIICCCRS